jgi:nucleotide-binding universal stress UspA family protein
MPNVDQFESVFRSAVHDTFSHQRIEFSTVLFVTDLTGDQARTFADRTRQFLKTLSHGDKPEWTVVSGDEFSSTEDLLQLVEERKPDLTVTYRNLHSSAWRYPHSLGSQLDVLLQLAPTPVLVLPHPNRNEAGDPSSNPLDTVMAMTSHLANDPRLVNHAARFVAPGGKLLLAHIEDEPAFEKFIEAIARIPTIDTDEAREKISRQLLKQPSDYVESCRTILADAGADLTVEGIVEFGHHLSSYRKLIDERKIDLLVMNTKDEDQLAMHGLAYPLAVELRDIPLLML